MAASWSVRAARLSDVPAVVESWHAMRTEAGLSDEQLVPSWRTTLAGFLEEHLAEGSAAVWVAVQEDRVVGTTLALLKRDYPFCLFAPGFYAFVGCVYTEATARRQGIATALVTRAVEWAREHGARRVRLLPTPASSRIYEGLGFGAVEDLDLIVDGEFRSGAEGAIIAG